MNGETADVFYRSCGAFTPDLNYTRPDAIVASLSSGDANGAPVAPVTRVDGTRAGATCLPASVARRCLQRDWAGKETARQEVNEEVGGWLAPVSTTALCGFAISLPV